MPAIADRVKETSTSTGNGNITLAGASLQFQSFNTAFGTSNPFYYVITDANGTDWEIGTGELSNSTTLVRTTVHQSSNSDNKIVLSSGTHSVFCAAPEVFLSDLASKSGKLSQFAATTSLELAGVISDETGSGALVFANSPAFTTPNIGTPSSGTLTNCTDLPIGGINGLGTGVGTALAVNTGTAGAFVVNGGALGTPLSGTVTNLTGTASININGTVGATTPSTGAFTSVTATSAFGILTRAAATQDGVALVGRAGGTSSWEVTLTPTTLTADRTLTLPDNSGTVLTSGAAVTVAQGGIGITSGTSGGVPYFSSTSAIASSALLANNAIMLGGGAGAAPKTTTTGTGVVTALGVDTGTAGAFVVNGGALGTPSSGTVTNLTGTASISINGTVGATTPNTGAFTTLSASGVATFSAGSASAPAITTSGDTNNGIFFPAADTTAITTAGSERLRVDSSGNVGIGTSSPTAVLQVYNATNGSITASGEEGALITSHRSGTTLSGGALALYKSRGTIASPTAVQNGDVCNINFAAYGGSNFRNVARARGWVDTYTSDTNISGYLTFETNAGSTASTERMRITSGGEVYIAGTADQGAYNLQCNGTGVWGAGAYVNGSDARIKENVAPIASGLSVVEKLNPVTFNYLESWSSDRSTQTGFIAQELQAAMADEVYVDGVVQQGPEYMSVAYQALIPILTKAIQEQQQQIDALMAEVAELKGN